MSFMPGVVVRSPDGQLLPTGGPTSHQWWLGALMHTTGALVRSATDARVRAGGADARSLHTSMVGVPAARGISALARGQEPVCRRHTRSLSVSQPRASRRLVRIDRSADVDLDPQSFL